MLYAGLFFWTLGYDTIYALQDKEDDALIGVRSTALLFGARARDWILGFYTVAFALILAAGYGEHAGWPFTMVMLAAGAHLVRQVHTLEIDNPEHCLALFRSNRDTGALIAAAFLLSSWIW
jgi:4-hydroxybenzoate polyprenyltransferase